MAGSGVENVEHPRFFLSWFAAFLWYLKSKEGNIICHWYGKDIPLEV
jgi:hypothetical protein